MIFTIALLASLLALIIAQYFQTPHRKHQMKLMRQFEGPPVLPVLGNALLFIQNSNGEYARLYTFKHRSFSVSFFKRILKISGNRYQFQSDCIENMIK